MQNTNTHRKKTRGVFPVVECGWRACFCVFVVVFVFVFFVSCVFVVRFNHFSITFFYHFSFFSIISQSRFSIIFQSLFSIFFFNHFLHFFRSHFSITFFDLFCSLTVFDHFWCFCLFCVCLCLFVFVFVCVCLCVFVCVFQIFPVLQVLQVSRGRDHLFTSRFAKGQKVIKKSDSSFKFQT